MPIRDGTCSVRPSSAYVMDNVSILMSAGLGLTRSLYVCVGFDMLT